MEKEEYKKLIQKKLPKENRISNVLVAFLVGGSIGAFSEFLSNYLVSMFEISKMTSYSVVCLITIFLASLFTALGFFDSWIAKAKCGLIVPTTGFAHSVSSAAIEYRKDGMITGIGANVFKLAGSVILYGIVSAFFFALLGVIIYG